MESDMKLKDVPAKLFGGVRMTWLKTILTAVICGVLTGVILLLPLPENCSLRNIGVCFEAWVLLALFVILNCGKPVEAALKTFVFFLISQPLVYLVQVPFASLHWQLFMYYKYWFIWTLLTLPGGFIAWFVKKQKWYSVVIFGVAQLLLCMELTTHFRTMLRQFPLQLLAALFIAAELVFFPLLLFRTKQRLASFAASGVLLAGCVALALLGIL